MIRSMEINLLALNVGNSRTAVGAFVGGKLLNAIRIANDDRAPLAEANPAAYAPGLANALNHLAMRLSEAGFDEDAENARREATKLLS